jgi:hypothetical protein
MTKRTRIVTETGSEYVWEAREDGTHWLGGRNVPNPYSKPIGEQMWQIETPEYKPRLGHEWLVFAVRSLAKTDPLRMPGGGKFTSPVSSIEHDNEEA